MDTGTSIIGSGNTVGSLLNVNPQVNADVNALNSVDQKAAGEAVRGGAVRGIGDYIGGSQAREH